MPHPSLLAILAHPDDESLGFGGTLAAYAAAGVKVDLVTATRGEAGRFQGIRPGDPGHPGAAALGEIRTSELRAAAATLGVREVSLLDCPDGRLDAVDPRQAIGAIVGHLRRVRPAVVVTFGPDGLYGHPDHIAISQFTTAAVVAAADPEFEAGACAQTPHRVTKLYYLTWSASTWSAYESAIASLAATVDGVARRAPAWPDWAITTIVDTGTVWATVSRAIACHHSQVSASARLRQLDPEHHRALWSTQSFYRAFSLINGGRARETSLFEGLAMPARSVS